MPKLIEFNDQLGQPHTFLERDFIDREAIYGVSINASGILMVQDSLSNMWEIPGGARDEAETDRECLARESEEETGLKLVEMREKVVSFVSYFFDLKSQQPWRTRRNFWLVTATSGIIRAQGNNEDVCRAARIPIANLPRTYIDKRVALAVGKAIIANNRP